MNVNFTGRIALVTGAGKGIGRCIALKLSKLGAKVYAVSRTEANLDSLKEEDSSIETRCLDIGDWDNTRKVIEDLGQVDLLVNNAAIMRYKTVLEATEEFIDEHFDINFKAALNISQIVAKGIISRKGSGAIVNISSIAGMLTAAGYSVYCTTKAAMDMLTKSMALEFGPLKIRVNSCNPCGVLTPLTEKFLVSQELKDAFTGRTPMGRFIGIGRCIALKLSKLGANVYSVSRTAADPDSLKVEDPSIETRCLDIGNWENTRKVIEDVGQVDLLVNNAAIVRFKTVLETTEELIDEHFDVNFKAALNISQIVAKGIISRKGSGAIVNISSIGGILAHPVNPVYCTTKAALDMLTKSMALEFGPLKIRVNSCNPGVVLTPMTEKLLVSQEQREAITGRIPMGRFIEQDEVANTVAFLLSDYASMINGALVPVDGGHIIHMSHNPVQ